jgi:hypothetical protein
MADSKAAVEPPPPGEKKAVETSDEEGESRVLSVAGTSNVKALAGR